jgi:translocation and assembly module TamA
MARNPVCAPNSARRARGCRAPAFALLALLAGAALADTVKVEVGGLNKLERANVLSLLGIAREQGDPTLSEGRIRLLHRRAKDDIRAALEPFGYYRVVVASNLQHEGANWYATYNVEIGPQIPIAEFDLQVQGEGASDAAFAALRAKLPIVVGAPLLHANYEEARRMLTRLATDRGYFDARFTRHEIRVDLARYTATIYLYFDTGPRYRFGPVMLETGGELSRDWLIRYVRFREGDDFDAAKLTELQSALVGSDYFSTVDVRPVPERAEGGRVPVEVRLALRKRDRYTAGAGFGTDTGARGKLGWERRYIGDRGQRFGTELNVSQIRTALTAQYTIPVYNPITDAIVLSTGWTHDYPDTSDSRTVKTGISLTRGFGEWRLTGYTTYQRERFEVANDSGDVTVLMPGATALWVRADNRVYTRRGYSVQLDVRGANDYLVSDVNFLQGRAQAKAIFPAGEDARLIVRGDGGATRMQAFDDMPATLRFYAGGDNSVRGYAYNSIGPLNAQGEVTGGKYLLVGSVEYEHRIYEKWSAALFYDYGNAFLGLGAGEPFKKGAGVGLRWRSPIGNVRLDVASAISEPDRPWRIHFTLGPDF